MKSNYIWSIFGAFVVVYAFLVGSFGAFGVIDDHTLIHTLFAGKSIPFFIAPSIGRLYPLDGQELNVLSLLFAPSAKVFYVFNAICVLLVVGCMVFVLQKALSLYADTKDSRVQYVVILCVLVVLLSPSFITAFLRLFVPERMEFVFLALFVASFVYMLAHQNSNNANIYIYISLLALA